MMSLVAKGLLRESWEILQNIDGNWKGLIENCVWKLKDWDNCEIG